MLIIMMERPKWPCSDTTHNKPDYAIMDKERDTSDTIYGVTTFFRTMLRCVVLRARCAYHGRLSYVAGDRPWYDPTKIQIFHSCREALSAVIIYSAASRTKARGGM